METNPLICSTNQCTAFYMIGTSVTNKLNEEGNESIVNSAKRKLTKTEI